MNYTRILVFGAHPDDEIRMAGTMAKLSAQGAQVVMAIFTNGSEGLSTPRDAGSYRGATAQRDGCLR